jgi:hypothetical protein
MARPRRSNERTPRVRTRERRTSGSIPRLGELPRTPFGRSWEHRGKKEGRGVAASAFLSVKLPTHPKWRVRLLDAHCLGIVGDRSGRQARSRHRQDRRDHEDHHPP